MITPHLHPEEHYRLAEEILDVVERQGFEYAMDESAEDRLVTTVAALTHAVLAAARYLAP